MDIKNFHITLVNGEKVFQSENSHFGVIDKDGRPRWVTSELRELLKEDFMAIYVTTKSKGIDENSITKIIPRHAILSFDKNTEPLTRKVNIEKINEND